MPITRREFIKILSSAAIVATVSPAALVEQAEPEKIVLEFVRLDIAQCSGGLCDLIRGLVRVRGDNTDWNYFACVVASFKEIASDREAMKSFSDYVKSNLKDQLSRRKGISPDHISLDFDLEGELVSHGLHRS